MTERRRLKLGAFMRPVSIHTGAWRYPGAYGDANFNVAQLKSFAQNIVTTATRTPRSTSAWRP